jgi:hypothetical protein
VDIAELTRVYQNKFVNIVEREGFSRDVKETPDGRRSLG